MTPLSVPPPATRTFPFGSSVAVWQSHPVERLPVGDHTPVTTFSGTVALTDPIVAEIVVDPSETPVVRPVVGPTVAMDGVPDAQLATLVTIAIVPSEYVPVAVSCRVSPTPENAGLGAIESALSIAGVTFRVVLPETDPKVALTTVEPTVNEVASPDVAFTVATVGVPEVQLMIPVKSAVLESLKVPVALNCCVSPFGTLGAAGVTAIDSRALTKETRAMLVVPLIK
jgi:hypothetical protein